MFNKITTRRAIQYHLIAMTEARTYPDITLPMTMDVERKSREESFHRSSKNQETKRTTHFVLPIMQRLEQEEGRACE